MAKRDINDLLKRRMSATQQAAEVTVGDEAYEVLFQGIGHKMIRQRRSAAGLFSNLNATAIRPPSATAHDIENRSDNSPTTSGRETSRR